jgi:ferrous iron transport protein A
MEDTVPRSLTDLPIGASGQVAAVNANGRHVPAELARRLADIGFLPGERVRIVARNVFSGEPIAVRVGTGTFALRKFEAACVTIEPDPHAV